MLIMPVLQTVSMASQENSAPTNMVREAKILGYLLKRRLIFANDILSNSL